LTDGAAPAGTALAEAARTATAASAAPRRAPAANHRLRAR
jgi:hypothetical protein